MTLEKAKQELEKFVQLKTTLRPSFVDVLLNAEEVVRCKDCKHNSLNRIIGNTYCDLGIGLSQLYDYCSHGEGREDETD